jgi:DNA end-binding protein Ku
MEEEGKVAIARFVMRSKQYLAALRPKDGVLVMSTMVYADELNDSSQLVDDVDDVDVSPKELTMATQLIESLTEPFEPEKFEDTHRNQVLDLIDRKAAGEEVVAAPEPAAEDKVVDLMAALEASVRDAKAARGRHPSAKAAGNGEDEAAEAESGGGRGRAKSRTAKKAAKASKASRSTKAAPKRKSA